MKTIITTDSVSNPKDMTNMVPCIVVDEKGYNYYDMKKICDDNMKIITGSEAFARAVNGERFHTASPIIGDFITLMVPYLEAGCNIVHLSTSSGISAGSVNASNMAKEFLNDKYGDDRVTVIDTLTGGSGGTLINKYANDLVDKGLSTKEIIKELEDAKKRLLTTYYISKVKGFVNSGRAPKIVGLSDRLSFRFRIDINEDGKLMPKLPFYRGGINAQFLKYIKDIINDDNISTYDPNYFALLVTQINEIDLEEAKDYIKSFDYFNPEDIEEIKFYSAISSYGVEDQTGIALIKKK